ncbi:protein FAR1-RELATED SEQUENCE [Trifolium repens]|nr:protein FAR1-RELATED SEQUENCE [Trifolium repens]
MKQYVCNKAGLRDTKHLVRLDRKIEHRRTSRTNCQARLRVKYHAAKGKYVVAIFVEAHNHELTPARFVHLHPLFRNISEADKAQIDGLQSHGIRTCHIMGYMVAQKGEYADVGFTKKDLYNYFDKKMRAVIKDGDVAAALNYLNVKTATDPLLFAEYDVDNSDGRMKTLFWADGHSRTDFFCFGDVLAFDTTNAGDYVKKAEFGEGFRKAMYSNFSKDEFEEYWSQMIKATGMEGNPWVLKTYNNRSMWATAYLRDQFFGRLRTTSQCEAVNAIIKTYVRKKGCIFEFMHNYDEALSGYRNNELVADFKSSCTDPVLTTQLRKIEGDAAKIYTADLFREVRDEILKAGELIVKDKTEVGATKIYKLTKYCRDDYERNVVYNGSTLECSCKLFDSHGIPCSHVFYVMKEEHVDHIPSNLVLSRWTKDAKIDYLNTVNCKDNVDSSMVEQARFASYCSVLTDFSKEASKKDGVYGQIMEDLMKLKIKYCSKDDPAIGTQKSVVGDPLLAKNKGAPKKPKKNETKTARRRSNCKNKTDDGRRCSGTQQTKEQSGEANVHLDSMSISDSVSLIAEKKKRKASGNGETSVQNNRSRGANVATTPPIDLTTTSRNFNPIYGLQPVMPMLNPMIQPMHLPPIYPMYGLQHGISAGQNSNSHYGLLQQVMETARND